MQHPDKRFLQIYPKPAVYRAHLKRQRKHRISKFIALLLDRNIPTRLILAGVFTPVEEEKHFWEIARRCKSYVKFHKWIQYDHIHEILQEGDVGLALLQPEPRYIATIPVKLFEYMAAGLPVICSNFHLIQNLVESTKCGALVNPTDRDTTVELLCSWWMDRIPRKRWVRMGDRLSVIRTTGKAWLPA